MSSALLWLSAALFLVALIGLVRGRIWFIRGRGKALAWMAAAAAIFALGAVLAPQPMDEMDRAAAEARANAAAARTAQANKDRAALDSLKSELSSFRSITSLEITGGRLTIKTNLSPFDRQGAMPIYLATRGKGFYSTTILASDGSVLIEK